MALSDHERQAWEELERNLANDFPDVKMTVADEPLPAGTLPQLPQRTLILLVILAVGTWLLLIGTLNHLLPMAITGLIIACVAARLLPRSGSTHRRRPRAGSLDQLRARKYS